MGSNPVAGYQMECKQNKSKDKEMFHTKFFLHSTNLPIKILEVDSEHSFLARSDSVFSSVKVLIDVGALHPEVEVVVQT